MRQKRRFQPKEIWARTMQVPSGCGANGTPVYKRYVYGMVEGNAVAEKHPKFNTAIRIVKILEKCLTALSGNAKVHESLERALQLEGK